MTRARSYFYFTEEKQRNSRSSLIASFPRLNSIPGQALDATLRAAVAVPIGYPADWSCESRNPVDKPSLIRCFFVYWIPGQARNDERGAYICHNFMFCH